MYSSIHGSTFLWWHPASSKLWFPHWECDLSYLVGFSLTLILLPPRILWFFNAFINLALRLSQGKDFYDLITYNVQQYFHLFSLTAQSLYRINFSSCCCITLTIILYTFVICNFNCMISVGGLNNCSEDWSTPNRKFLY